MARSIEVWLDSTSDAETPVWCVSLVDGDGDEIRCLSTHTDEADAWEAVRAMHTGWTAGDGSGHDGYQLLDYWEPDESRPDTYRYSGPDSHGIEPVLATT